LATAQAVVGNIMPVAIRRGGWISSEYTLPVEKKKEIPHRLRSFAWELIPVEAL